MLIRPDAYGMVIRFMHDTTSVNFSLSCMVPQTYCFDVAPKVGDLFMSARKSVWHRHARTDVKHARITQCWTEAGTANVFR